MGSCIQVPGSRTRCFLPLKQQARWSDAPRGSKPGRGATSRRRKLWRAPARRAEEKQLSCGHRYHLEAWKDTCETLHMWTQIVGKVRMELSPFVNHWWHVTSYVTPRGLTTSSIPYQGSTFAVDFDFIDHTLFIRTSEGTSQALPLIPCTVATFYREFMAYLHALGIDVTINTMPSEVQHPIRCDQDEVHSSYD